MNQTDIRYILSEAGFRILLSSAGIKQLPCFTVNKNDKTESPEVYQEELFRLVKRGLIEIRNDEYVLKAPFTDIIKTIRDRSKTILIQGEDVEKLYYIAGDYTVAATPGRKADEYICIWILDRSGMIEHMQSILPEDTLPEEVRSEKEKGAGISESYEKICRIEIMGKEDQTEGVYNILFDKDELYYEKDDEIQIYMQKEFISNLMDESR